MSTVTVEGKGGRPRLGAKNDRLEYRLFGLLESQIEWLAKQPDGASATIRNLVDRAMKRNRHANRKR